MTGQVTLHRQRIEVLQCNLKIRVSDLQCNCALKCSVICHLNFFILTFQAKHHLVQAEIEFFSAFLILENLDLVTLHHFDF